MSIITGIVLYDIIGISVAALTLFLIYSKWAFQYWKNRGVPYLEPTMIWGNLQPPHRRKDNFGDQVANIYQAAKDKGWRHVGWYNITRPIYTPVDLEILKNIITKDFQHFTHRGIYINEKKEPITAHLFLIGGKKWRNLRMKFTPTFTSGKMRIMFQTLADCGIQMEKYLVQELAQHEPIEIKNVLGNFSTDIIGSCAFGLECNSFKDPNTPFRVMGKRIFLRSPWQNITFVVANVFPKFAKFVGITNFDDDIKQFFTNVVVDTVNYREKNQIRRNDFLQMLIDIKNNKEGQEYEGDGTSLTINEMVAQSFVFFIAGFETSSTTMTFTLFELAKNPVLQQKVRDEIIEVLKKHDGKITYDALKEMKFLSQVIDETLRMHPPVPFITRLCMEDYVIPTTNVKLKKGQQIFVSIKGIHYDEEYYPNSKVFDPERFSDENKHQRHQYAHIPFGEGPRMCIGMRFGLMQTKVGLISILKNFEISLSKKTQQPLKFDVNSILPQIAGGIWLDMKKIV